MKWIKSATGCSTCALERPLINTEYKIQHSKTCLLGPDHWNINSYNEVTEELVSQLLLSLLIVVVYSSCVIKINNQHKN